MHRRAFLTTLGILTAGCTRDPPAPGSPSPTQTASQATPSITNRAFAQRSDCPNPGTATVAFGQGTVSVSGCLYGRNGCAVPTLAEASYDADRDALTVIVATKIERDPGEACTEVLTRLGYRAEIGFADSLPETVVVVHDGAEGRQEVARIHRD